LKNRSPRCKYRDAPVIIGEGNLATVVFRSTCSCGWVSESPQRDDALREIEWQQHKAHEG